MAIYYTDQQKDEIRAWLLELRRIVNPVDFPANRDRARELVSLLDQHPTHPACLISCEYQRVRKLWRRLDAQARQAEKS
jgi:hypothetical protein